MLSKQVLVISLIIPLIEYYCLVAVHKATKNLGRITRRVALLLYILLSISVIVSLIVFRNWATTEWPNLFMKTLVNLLIGVFFGKFVVAGIMFAGDILILLKAVAKFLVSIPDRAKRKPVQENTITRSQFISSAALATGALFTASLGYGMSNRYRYKLRYVPVSIDSLPKELKKLRIAQISDIHTGSFDNPAGVKEGIEMALAEKPDIIVFTGDLVNYRSEELEPYEGILRKLDAPLGVYSVLGNHDYSDYLNWPSLEAKNKDFEQLKKQQKAMGWNLLLNENVILRHNGAEFALIGSENWGASPRFHKYGDLSKATKGLAESGIPLKILLSHDPTHWDAKVRPGHPDVNLTLSGHTHGMQLGVDFKTFKWSPAQYIYRQWAGLYREGNQYLYVNRGFGFIGYNGRLGVLPEITLLEII